jgi:hypothetical protein
VPGDLAAAHLWLLAGALLAACGGAAAAVEWGLRGFQSYRDATLAGRLDLDAGEGRPARAAWSDLAGRRAGEFRTSCPRIVLEGEFVEWSRLGKLAGFRDRHRVVAARLSCAGSAGPAPGGAPAADGGTGVAAPGEILHLRPPSRAWEALRRYDRFLPLLRAERRQSPPLRLRGGSWRLFVMPAGYAFAE